MIKASRFHHSSVGTTLYYVRLQTYSGLALFDSERRLTGGESQNSLQNSRSSPIQTLTSAAAVLTQIAADELAIAAQYQDISINQWVIFPNGLHALISVKDKSSDGHASSRKPRLLTLFVARFKAATAKRINLVRNQPGAPVWQRSYEEQVVQDEMALARLNTQIMGAKEVIASGGALIHQC